MRRGSGADGGGGPPPRAPPRPPPPPPPPPPPLRLAPLGTSPASQGRIRAPYFTISTFTIMPLSS
jgi:hypothetical protein